MANKSAGENLASKKLQPDRHVSEMKPLESFEQFFDDVMSHRWMHPSRFNWSGFPELAMFGKNLPKVDIIDRDNEVFIRTDVPGIKKENLDISLTDYSVTISGKSDEEKKEQEGEYFCHETSHGEFERTLKLPAEINTEKAHAVFTDGVLKLTLPKVKQSARRTVKIQ